MIGMPLFGYFVSLRKNSYDGVPGAKALGVSII